MHRQLLIIAAFALFGTNTAKSQVILPDTSDFPYWIDMMKDPSVNFYKTQRAFELFWANRPIEKGSGYKPFKRWEYDQLELIDAKGNIPAPGVLLAEVERYLALYNSAHPSGGMPGALGNAPCLTGGNWKDIGPTNMPKNTTSQPNGLGRINALAFHPKDSNIIYAGAPAGGLWVSKNGGATWMTTTDTLATLGVSAIAIDPTKPDTMYLGTGDRDASDAYGRGVLKSKDGGKTWFSANATMGNATVGRLIIDPKNTQILLAATSGGIYRSTNGATSWTRVSTGNYEELVFDAVNTNYVYATTAGTVDMYRSTNNGVNWTKVTGGLPTGKSRMVVGVTPADSNFVYNLVTNSSTFAGLYLSTNRGVSFKLMSDTPNIMDYSHLGSGTGGQAWYDLDIAVDPKDKRIVYSAGVNIFQSLDSGKTWKINAHWVGSGGAPNVHADNHILEYQPKTNKLFVGNDGGVYFTGDRGKTWKEISDGLGIAQIYRLGQGAKNPDLIINGYQDNGTGLFDNGVWKTIMGGDGMDCLIDPTDETWSYSDLYYGDIRRYKNGAYTGIVGKSGTNGITESGGWVTPFILREGNSNTMFAGYKNVWKTTNVKATSVGSISWTKISNNLGGSNTQNITVLENSYVDDNLLYVARADNKLFKTLNANAATPTWVDLTSNLPNAAAIQWVETHGKYKNRVWICQSNKIYQSDDGGNSWTNMSTGLPNLPVMCVTFDSSSKNHGLYLGTYMGVYYKDTTMSSWTWFNTNMPTTGRVRDIEIYYSAAGRDKSHVVCATYGRGNWRSPLYDEERTKPVAGFKASQQMICLNNAVSFTDTSGKIPTQWQWQFTPNTVSYLNGTDSCSQNPVVRFNAKGKYNLKFWAANCGGIDSVDKSQYIEVFDAITTAVCTNTTTNIGNFGIGVYGVKIAALNHSSNGPEVEGAYVDRACTDIVHLKTDTAYLSTITTGTTYNEFVKVFIDFNNNGNLNDAGEMVFNRPKGKITHQDSIQIPKNPVTNTLLRMRVMSDYDTVTGNSCANLKYGQTEDFGVVIESRIPKPHLVIDTNRICKNGTIMLSDTSKGSIYKRRWYVSSYGSLTFKKDGDGPINFILPDTGWYYAQLVLNDSLISQRIDSIVYVKPLPTEKLVVISGKLNSCENVPLTLSNGGLPAGKITNTWYKNGSLLAGETATTFSRAKLASTDSGSYYSIVDLNGCKATSSTVMVNITPTPKATFNPNQTEACYLKNLFIFSNASTISTGTLSYDWTFGAGAPSTATYPTFSYSDTGKYTVQLIAKSGNGCADTAKRVVNVWSSPTANFTINNTSQCLNQNNFDFTNTSTIDVGTLTDSWRFGDLNTAITKNASHTYTAPNTYNVALITISNKGCADTSTQTIVVNPSPLSDFNITTIERCGNANSFDFADNSNISTGLISSHKWIFGDGSNSLLQDVMAKNISGYGSFDVQKISISALGCSDTSLQKITIDEKPVAAFKVNMSQQCLKGNLFAITNTSAVGAGSIVSNNWKYGDGNSSINATPPSHTYISTGNYVVTLIVQTDKGCIDSVTINTEVFASPTASFIGGEGCVGEVIDFENTSSVNSGVFSTFAWDFGDNKTASDKDPGHVYSKSGTFEVKLVVTTNNGCKDTAIDKTAAVIYVRPKASFSYSKVGFVGLSTDVEFKDESVNAVNWNWWLGNSATSSIQHPSTTFVDSGTYDIGLIVTSLDGCEDTLFKKVFIFPEGKLMVANAFTPNGDALNEVLIPSGLGYVKKYYMAVYNRWGVKLFETTLPQEGWNGRYQDKIVEPGVYLVNIIYTDLQNNKQRYDATVRILR